MSGSLRWCAWPWAPAWCWRHATSSAEEWLNQAARYFQECSDPFGRCTARLWQCLAWQRQGDLLRCEQVLPEVLAASQERNYDYLFTQPTLLGPAGGARPGARADPGPGAGLGEPLRSQAAGSHGSPRDQAAPRLPAAGAYSGRFPGCGAARSRRRRAVGGGRRPGICSRSC